MSYKPHKKTNEMVKYLSEYKNIEFKKISPLDAEEYLVRYNYINIISPFKFITADQDPTSTIEYISLRDDEGNHIYSETSDFSDYYEYFKAERDDYINYYVALSKFELAFKSILTSSFMTTYNVRNSKDAKTAFMNMSHKVHTLTLNSTGNSEAIAHRKELMKKSFSKFIKNLDPRFKKNGVEIESTDIYIMFDRMYLTELLTVYICLKPIIRRRVYEKLIELGLELGAENKEELESKIFNLVAIRNSIMHYNSLEILKKYSNYKKKIIRENNSRKDYENLLFALNYIYKNVA